MRYTVRRIDGHWTLFNGTGPIAHAGTIAELKSLVSRGDDPPHIEVCGKRGKA